MIKHTLPGEVLFPLLMGPWRLTNRPKQEALCFHQTIEEDGSRLLMFSSVEERDLSCEVAEPGVSLWFTPGKLELAVLEKLGVTYFVTLTSAGLYYKNLWMRSTRKGTTETQILRLSLLAARNEFKMGWYEQSMLRISRWVRIVLRENDLVLKGLSSGELNEFLRQLPREMVDQAGIQLPVVGSLRPESVEILTSFLPTEFERSLNEIQLSCDSDALTVTLKWQTERGLDRLPRRPYTMLKQFLGFIPPAIRFEGTTSVREENFFASPDSELDNTLRQIDATWSCLHEYQGVLREVNRELEKLYQLCLNKPLSTAPLYVERC